MSKDNSRRGSLDGTDQPLTKGRLLTRSTRNAPFGMYPMVGFVDSKLNCRF